MPVEQHADDVVVILASCEVQSGGRLKVILARGSDLGRISRSQGFRKQIVGNDLRSGVEGDGSEQGTVRGAVAAVVGLDLPLSFSGKRRRLRVGEALLVARVD